MKTINVAKDFSKTPFGRYGEDSPNSAEKFREDILIPAFSDNTEDIVEIDFSDIAMGLGSSFLEEAFGGMVRRGIDAELIKKRIKIKSNLPIYEDQIFRFINLATSNLRKN